MTATDGHEVWTVDRGWVDADHLQPGDQLLTARGDRRTIDAVRDSSRTLAAYNLRVADLHTYYVRVGNDPILVHNCGSGKLSDPLPRGLSNAHVKAYEDIRAGQGVPRTENGSQKTFQGRNHAGKWAGALEYEVPGAKDPSQARILEKTLGDGRKVMGWTDNHYDTIHPFQAPHFPDSGW